MAVTDDPHTWTYDLRKNEWRDMGPESMPATDRNDAVLAYDPVSRKVVALVKVTRGEGEDATHRLDTWAYPFGVYAYRITAVNALGVEGGIGVGYGNGIAGRIRGAPVPHRRR